MLVPIVYFTSSNNTAYIAGIIAAGLGSENIQCRLVKVEDVIAGKVDISGAGVIGLGAPIYGGFAEPVLEWAKKHDFSSTKVFLFSTAAIAHMGSTGEMIDVITKKGGSVIGALEVKFTGAGDGIFFVERFSSRFAIDREGLVRALRFGEDIERVISRGEGFVDSTYRHRLGWLSLAVVRPIKAIGLFFIKRSIFHVKPDKCIRCKKCEKACPSAAIKVDNGGPVFYPGDCIACFRCLKECPTAALSLRLADNVPYYRGPWQLKGYVEPAQLKIENVKKKN